MKYFNADNLLSLIFFVKMKSSYHWSKAMFFENIFESKLYTLKHYADSTKEEVCDPYWHYKIPYLMLKTR